MTNNAGANGSSFVKQYGRRVEGPRSEEPADDRSSSKSIYSLVGVALVVIALVSVFSGPTMNRNVSDAAQVLRDTRSANEANTSAYEAVTLAVLTASEQQVGLATPGSVSAAVGQAHTRLALFGAALGAIPIDGDASNAAVFVDSAEMVLRHIESGSTVTAEAFLTTRLQPIHSDLSAKLELKHQAAVRGILEAEANAEQTALLTRLLAVLAVVSAGVVVLLVRWRQVPEGPQATEAAVLYLRRVS